MNHWRRIALLGLPILPCCLFLIFSATLADKAQSVRVLRDNSIEVDGEKGILLGAVIPISTEKCADGERQWPCGATATLRLHALLQDDLVTCTVERSDSPKPFMQCQSSTFDIAEILIAEGWGVVPHSDTVYGPIEFRAKSSGVGIWRGGFEPPEHWRNYPDTQFDPIEDLLCSECAVRNKQ